MRQCPRMKMRSEKIHKLADDDDCSSNGYLDGDGGGKSVIWQKQYFMLGRATRYPRQ